jgi:hypothetical protein
MESIWLLPARGCTEVIVLELEEDLAIETTKKIMRFKHFQPDCQMVIAVQKTGEREVEFHFVDAWVNLDGKAIGRRP